MKNIFFIFLTILLTPFHTIFPSMSFTKEKPPIGGSVVSFNILRTGQEQGLYLLGENHTYDRIAPKENANNFLFLRLLLLKAEQEKVEREYHVFVEHRFDLFSSYAADKVPATMMKGILPLSQKADFKHVVVESCEVRKIIGALQNLSVVYPNPLTPQTYPDWEQYVINFQNAFGFDIKTLTFRDILREFDRLQSQMKEYMDTWDDALIKEEFRKSLAETDSSFAYVRGFLEGKNPCGKSILTDDWTPFPVIPPTEFDVDESIFSFCCKDPEKRFLPFLCWIQKEVILGFGNFVDLYLFHRVLELRKETNPVKKVMFVGGAGHCSALMFQLIRAVSAQSIYSLTFSQEHFSVIQFIKVAKPLAEIERQENVKKQSWCVLL